MEVFFTLIPKIISLGGSVMVPLILLSIFALGLIVDLIWTNFLCHRNLKLLLNNHLPKKSFDPVSISHFLADSVEEKLNLLNFELNKLERKTSYLGIIASISPLIGLLGTVFGMIRIFNVVATQKPTDPIVSLSGGISEALFATAGGLIVAIIAGFSYHFLNNSLDSVQDKSFSVFKKSQNEKEITS